MNVAERSVDVTSCGEGMSSFDEEAMVDVEDKEKSELVENSKEIKIVRV